MTDQKTSPTDPPPTMTLDITVRASQIEPQNESTYRIVLEHVPSLDGQNFISNIFSNAHQLYESLKRQMGDPLSTSQVKHIIEC